MHLYCVMRVTWVAVHRLVPPILYFFSKVEGLRTNGEIDRAVMSRFFIFQVMPRYKERRQVQRFCKRREALPRSVNILDAAVLEKQGDVTLSGDK